MSQLDDLLSLEWEIDDDGQGEAVLVVSPSADVPGGRYEFEALSELPDLLKAIILDEGVESGEWSGNDAAQPSNLRNRVADP